MIESIKRWIYGLSERAAVNDRVRGSDDARASKLPQTEFAAEWLVALLLPPLSATKFPSAVLHIMTCDGSPRDLRVLLPSDCSCL